MWEDKNIEVDVELEDSAYVYGDENLMEIVWNNLLSNALKFTEPGGKVAVSQESRDESVIIQIKDSGCGMSKGCVKRIFDKFYQGDTSHSKEGNGLGLALVKRVLELMDGKIEIESEPGKGSTFTVVMPGAIREENRR